MLKIRILYQTEPLSLIPYNDARKDLSLYGIKSKLVFYHQLPLRVAFPLGGLKA